MLEAATVGINLNAQVGGFDAASRAIDQSMKALVDAATKTLQRLPEQIEAAMKRAAASEERIARETAGRVVDIRRQLEDRNAKLTLDATQLRVRQMEREAEKTHQLIMETVQDRKEAWALIEENARITEGEITRIHEQAEAQRLAVTEAAQKAATDAQVKAAEERRQALGQIGLAAGVGAGALGLDLNAQKEAAAEFDTNMRNFNSLAQQSEEQLAATGEAVLNFGKTIPKAAGDMSAALYDIQSSGFSGQTALDTLKLAGEGAAAGLATTGEAAQVLTGSMNAWNTKTGPDAQRIMDVLFQTVNLGVVNFSQLARNMGDVSSTAATAGVPIEAVGAAIAYMTSKGIQAPQAFTALNGMLTKIAAPSETAAEAGRAMGLAWFNAAEAGEHLKKVGLGGALKEIAEATGGDLGKLKLLLEDAEAIKGAAAMSAQGGQGFLAFLKEMENSAGATKKALEEQAKAYNFQAQLFENSMERMRISGGKTVLETLNPMAQAGAGIVEAFNQLPDPLKKAVVVVEMLAFAALSATAAIAGVGFAAMGTNAALPVLAGAAGRAGVTAAASATSWAALGAAIWAAILPALPILGALALAVGAVSLAIHLQNQRVEDEIRVGAEAIEAKKKGLAQDQAREQQLVRLAEEHDKLAGKVKRTKEEEARLKAVGVEMEKLFPGVAAALKKAGDQHWANSEAVRAERNEIRELARWRAYDMKLAAAAAQAKLEAAQASLNTLREQQRATDMADVGGDPEAARAMAGLRAGAGMQIGAQQRLVDGLAKNAIEAVKAAAAAQAALAEGPGAAAGSSGAAGGAGSGGGGALMTESRVKKDVEALMTRAKAHRETTDQMIADLQKYKAEKKLTGAAADIVDEKIVTLQEKSARAGAAATSRAESEKRKQAALTAKEEQQRLKELSGYVAQQLGEITRQRVKAAKDTHDANVKALKAEKDAIGELVRYAEGADAEKLRNRMAAIDQELTTAATAQKAAAERVANEIAAAEDRTAADSLARRLMKIDQHYAKEIAAAKKASLSTKGLEDARDKERAKAIADNAKEVQALLDAQEGNAWDKRLARETAKWDALIALQKKGSEEERKLIRAKGLATAAIDKEEREKLLAGLEKGLGDVLGVLDKFADKNATAWAQMAAAGGLFVSTFRDQIAEELEPALKGVQKAVVEELKPQIMDAGKQLVDLGGKAVGLLMEGNPVAIAMAAVVAVGAVASAAALSFEAAAREQEKLRREAAAFAEEIARIYDGIERSKAKQLDNAARAASFDVTKEAQEAQDALKAKKATLAMYQGMADTGASSSKGLYQGLAAQLAAEIEREEKQMEGRKTARLTAIEAERAEKLKALSRETTAAIYATQEAVAVAAEDKEGARRARQLAEEARVWEAREDFLAAYPDQAEMAEATAQARVKAIRAKFAAEELAEREAAHKRDQELAADQEALEAAIFRRRQEEQRATGAITEAQYVKNMAALENGQAQAAATRAAQDVDFYRGQLEREDLTAEQRRAIHQKLMDAMVKAESMAADGMKKAIEDYRQAEEAKFRANQEAIEEKRRALQDEMDAELETHEQTMRNLTAEEKKYQNQLALIDAVTRKIKAKYDEERNQFSAADKGQFQAALSGVTLGPDSLRYEDIEAEQTAAENRRRLEEITQEEFLAISVQTALKKAALAQKELADDKVTFKERTRIQGILADAYEEYQEAHLDLIAEKEEAELRTQDQARLGWENKLAMLNEEKVATQVQIDTIREKYRLGFEQLDTQYKANAKAWKDSMEAIAAGTAPVVAQIVGEWGKVAAEIDRSIAKAQQLANLRGSYSYGSGQSGTFTQAISFGSPSQIRQAIAQAGVQGAATGGYMKGGKKGVDSIPLMVQDGELIVDNPMTAGLGQFLAWFQAAIAGGPALALAGAGGGYVDRSIHFHDPVVREDADLERLAREVSRYQDRDSRF